MPPAAGYSVVGKWITHKLILKSLEIRYRSGKAIVRDVNLCLNKMIAA
jgi:hypothetical protein